MTVDGSRSDAKHDHGYQPADGSDSLFALRTLVITALAIVIGLFVRLAAGISAGIAAATAANTMVGLTVGLTSGIAAALVSGLTAAGALHALVGRAR